MSTPTKHNLNALLVGTGEFRFSKGATSAADAKLKGFRDFGNIMAFTPETDVKMEEHEGSYRGRKIIDRKFATQMKLEYLLTADEWKRSNLRFIFLAEDGQDWTQSAFNGAGDSMAFTTTPADSNPANWYDIYVSGSQIRQATSISMGTTPAAAVTPETSGHTVGETGTARTNNDPVIFSAATMPTGITAGTTYYVINKSTDAFQVSATVGGSAILFSTTGTTVKAYKGLTPGTDYEVDLQLGSVKFITAQAATVYPVVNVPAVTSNDDGYFFGIVPMQEAEQVGYGRVICYDQDDDNNVVYDHRDFSCVVTAEKSKAVDGKKTSEFDVRVSVTADPGILYVRRDNDEPETTEPLND